MSTVKISVDKSIDKAVAEFRQSDMVIAGLASSYLPLTISGVDDRKGYLAVREARLEVKGLRVQVEHKRKELKEDALKYGKAVDAEAHRLKALIEPIEEHLKKQEDAYDAAKEKIKAEKAAAAELALQKRIDRLTAARCPIADVAFLREIDDKNFEMYFSKAVEVQTENERLAQVEADRLAAIAAEEKAEQDRIEAAAKAERERIAAEQHAELLRQQEVNRIEAERLETVRAEIHRQQQEAFKQQEVERAEMKRQQDKINAENAELRRQQDEARKASELRAETERLARLESLKPEIEKARAFHDAVDRYVRGYLDQIGKPTWSDVAIREIEAACNQITTLVGNGVAC